jgi:hypothetical protein
VGVELTPLPARKLFQVEIKLRLENTESDGARSNSATNIRQKVVGIVKCEGDAVAR